MNTKKCENLITKGGRVYDISPNIWSVYVRAGRVIPKYLKTTRALTLHLMNNQFHEPISVVSQYIGLPGVSDERYRYCALPMVARLG